MQEDFLAEDDMGAGDDDYERERDGDDDFRNARDLGDFARQASERQQAPSSSSNGAGPSSANGPSTPGAAGAGLRTLGWTRMELRTARQCAGLARVQMHT